MSSIKQILCHLHRKINKQNQQAKHDHDLMLAKFQIPQRFDSLLLENPKDWMRHKLRLSQTLPVTILDEASVLDKKNPQSPKQPIDSILLEFPETWVQDEFILPNRSTTDYFVNISLVLSKMNLKTKQVPRFGFSDTAPCLPDDNQICISFHSHGSEPRVWRVKESYIAPYFTFDRMGYSGFSELAQHPENFTNTIAQFPLKRAVEVVYNCKKMLIKKNLSKYHQPDISNMELPKDYVFYPLQTVVDTVAIFARITQTDAIWHLAEQSAKHGVALVLKRHPHCTDIKTQQAIEAVVKKYPNTHLIDASVNELIPNARAIVGANSGVLFEALIHGKPVYSFASSDFQLATIALQDNGDFAKVFARPAKQGDDIVRFLGWYLEEYCFRSDSLKQLENKIKTCLEASSLSIPPNAATRDYIKNVFRTLELARRHVITDNTPHYYAVDDVPKRIYSLWMQGEENAPELVKRNWQRWQRMNPEYELIILDKESSLAYLTDFPFDVSALPVQAYSDIIRLTLLMRYGGIWTDATVFPVKPLSQWLPMALEENGFFAYDRGLQDPRPISSWFLVATVDSLIMKKWYDLMRAYWFMPRSLDTTRDIYSAIANMRLDDLAPTPHYPYFWVEHLFAHLLKTDEACADAWDKVAKLSSIEPHKVQDLFIRETDGAMFFKKWRYQHGFISNRKQVEIQNCFAGAHMQKLTLYNKYPVPFLEKLADE